jgi:hypothetical protein
MKPTLTGTWWKPLRNGFGPDKHDSAERPPLSCKSRKKEDSPSAGPIGRAAPSQHASCDNQRGKPRFSAHFPSIVLSWTGRDSNPRPRACEARDLPLIYQPHCMPPSGGPGRGGKARGVQKALEPPAGASEVARDGRPRVRRLRRTENAWAALRPTGSAAL